MNTYLLLFRGINVGGKNILPMQDLVAVLEQNSYRNIRTYIQSGNVVLQSQHKPGNKISSLIQEKFGLQPEIVVLEASEFNAAVNNNPYTSTDGKTIHFYFCKTRPNINTDKLEQYRDKSEKYSIEGKVFYLYAPNGIGRSKLVANIETCLGVPATGRNLNTVRKLQTMLDKRK